MFDTLKFGKALSDLRKKADMSQNEVADRLNLSRQAISKYERGESFPDISVLVNIADLFGITLDELIGYGGPRNGEYSILRDVANGKSDPVAEDISDVVNLAPLLKPSVLEKLSAQFEKEGIDISDVVTLSEFLNGDTVARLIENAKYTDEVSDEILEKFIPLLGNDSKEVIFQKILDGELDWHLIKVLLPYAEYMQTQIEAAVIYGVLPYDVIKILNDYWIGRN